MVQCGLLVAVYCMVITCYDERQGDMHVWSVTMEVVNVALL